MKERIITDNTITFLSKIAKENKVKTNILFDNQRICITMEKNCCRYERWFSYTQLEYSNINIIEIAINDMLDEIIL